MEAGGAVMRAGIEWRPIDDHGSISESHWRHGDVQLVRPFEMGYYGRSKIWQIENTDEYWRTLRGAALAALAIDDPGPTAQRVREHFATCCGGCEWFAPYVRDYGATGICLISTAAYHEVPARRARCEQHEPYGVVCARVPRTQEFP